MKRFLLYSIGGLAIIAALAYGFRREIFVYAITPAAPFTGSASPAAPDYALSHNWAALPDRADSVDIVPAGIEADDGQADAKVDVFFIHPTTHYKRSGWNAALDDSVVNQRTQSGALRHQASVFNGCCRIYAPRYRQAALAAFVDANGNGLPALELAYADVKAAFDYYLAHYNQGRPFILAGHSQGARHGIRLLAEEIDGKPHAARMAAAYLVGYPINLTGNGQPFAHTPLCATQEQTGCVVSWSTALEGSDTRKFRPEIDLSPGLPEVQRSAKGPQLCVNPVSWENNGAADAAAHQGAIVFSRDLNMPLGPLQKNLISTRCESGYLFISDPGAAFHRLVMPGGNYHNYDYNLFYMNIRENAILRSRAHLARGAKF